MPSLHFQKVILLQTFCCFPAVLEFFCVCNVVCWLFFCLFLLAWVSFFSSRMQGMLSHFFSCSVVEKQTQCLCSLGRLSVGSAQAHWEQSMLIALDLRSSNRCLSGFEIIRNACLCIYVSIYKPRYICIYISKTKKTSGECLKIKCRQTVSLQHPREPCAMNWKRSPLGSSDLEQQPNHQWKPTRAQLARAHILGPPWPMAVACPSWCFTPLGNSQRADNHKFAEMVSSVRLARC